MVCGGHRVKFGAVAVCPICYGAELWNGKRERPGDTFNERPNFFERNMSAFSEHQEELERYEQMFGVERGRLAVSLDRLTNALVLVGQHGVYCTSLRNPAVPAMDLRIISLELTHAKELVQSAMEELRKGRAGGG